MTQRDDDHRRPPGEKVYWLDRPENVRKVFYALIGLCALSVLADLFYDKHVHYTVEKLIGAYAIFGFVSAVGLVLAAKEMRKLLMRDEDYYDDDD